MSTHGIDPQWVEDDVLEVLDRAFEEARNHKIAFGATWVFKHLIEGRTGAKILQDVPRLGTRESILHRLSNIRFNPAGPGLLSHAWKEIIAASEKQMARQISPIEGTQFAGLILKSVGPDHNLYEALFPNQNPTRNDVVDKLLHCHLHSVTMVPTRRDIRRTKQALSKDEARQNLTCWMGSIEGTANEGQTLRLVWFGQPHRLIGHSCDAVLALYRSWFQGEDSLTTRKLTEAMGITGAKNAANLLLVGGRVLKGISSLVRFEDGQWSMIVPPEHDL